MSRESVVICDRCGKRADPDLAEIGAVVGREMDAAGSLDDVWRTIDLCGECQHRALRVFLGGLDYRIAQAWLATWGKRTKGGD